MASVGSAACFACIQLALLCCLAYGVNRIAAAKSSPPPAYKKTKNLRGVAPDKGGELSHDVQWSIPTQGNDPPPPQPAGNIIYTWTESPATNAMSIIQKRQGCQQTQAGRQATDEK